MIREEKRMDEGWTEEIMKLFREMVNFYRMEYSQPLIRLFNEFAFLLLCLLHSRDKAPKESEIRKLPSAALTDVVKDLEYAQEQRQAKYRITIQKSSVLRPMLLVACRLAEWAWMRLNSAAKDETFEVAWGQKLYEMLYRLLELCAGDKSEKGRYLLRERDVEQLLGLVEEEGEKARRILDPQCGAAAMLIAAGRRFRGVALYGREEDEDWYKAAYLLGCFSGFFLTLEMESAENGTGKYERQEYDLVLANPLFTNRLVAGQEAEAYFSTIHLRIRSLYHLQIVDSLLSVRSNGKALLFVPDSFLFASKNESVRVRKWMLDTFAVDGVILLPESAFMGNVTVKASLLVVGNPLMAGGWEDSCTQRIFFYDLRGQAERRDGKAYDALLACWDKRQAYYEEWQELLAAGGQENYNGVRTPEKWEHTDCWFAEIEEIRKAGGTLLPDYYRPAGRQEIHFAPPEELLREMIDMQERIAEEMRALLTEVEGL